MTWVRLDDHIDEHPKVAAAGPLGIALYIVSIAYANRNLTDGFIPNSVASRLITLEHPDAAGDPWPLAVTSRDNGAGFGTGSDLDIEDIIGALVTNGLWKPVKGGYRIHDYNDYQPSKAQVLAERKAARERMAKGRNSKGSPEQQTNNPRSSEEVREKFKDPVPGSTKKPPYRTASPKGPRAERHGTDDQHIDELLKRATPRTMEEGMRE